MDEADLRSVAESLSRLQQGGSEGPGSPSKQDAKVLDQLETVLFNENERIEEPLPTARPETPEELFALYPLVERYESAEQGLLAHGWIEFGKRQFFGKGVFGSVCIGIRANDNRPEDKKQVVAVKTIPLSRKGGAVKAAFQEIAVMRALKHPNIINYFGHFWIEGKQESEASSDETDAKKVGVRKQKDYFYVVILMEYLSAGELKEEMKRYPLQKIPEEYARHYAKEVGNALVYVHSKGIVHHDLHKGNIILKYMPDRTKSAILCDFSFAKWGPDNRNGYGRDIMTFVNFFIQDMLRGLEYKRGGGLNQEHTLSDEAKRLLLQRRPNTVAEVLQHPWFQLRSVAPVATFEEVQSSSMRHRSVTEKSLERMRRKAEKKGVQPPVGPLLTPPPAIPPTPGPSTPARPASPIAGPSGLPPTPSPTPKRRRSPSSSSGTRKKRGK